VHRDLREHLHTATGESGFVIAVFLDVRGFSSFAKIAESSETAVFLKSVYTKILDDYFKDASFFKPTGDGLLIIVDYDEGSLKEVARAALKTSLDLVEAFPTLTEGDPMINFPVPQHLGIGLARGAATRLVSEDRTLDYSGRPLNLAARLMDVARPSGVVFDATLGIELLEEQTQSRFREERVYVKGIADDEPIDVFVSSGVTIPDYNRTPLQKFTQHLEPREETTFATLADRGYYLHRLSLEPADTRRLQIHVSCPKVSKAGRKHPTMWTTRTFPAQYLEERGKRFATINYDDITLRFKDDGVKGTWPVRIEIEYPVRPASVSPAPASPELATSS
jgi:class 3 adenylate cyclase